MDSAVRRTAPTVSCGFFEQKNIFSRWQIALVGFVSLPRIQSRCNASVGSCYSNSLHSQFGSRVVARRIFRSPTCLQHAFDGFRSGSIIPKSESNIAVSYRFNYSNLELRSVIFERLRRYTSLKRRNLSKSTFSMSSRMWYADNLEIVANPSLLNKELLSRLSRLNQPYKSIPILSNPHVETIFGALFRSCPEVKYRRECLRMADGGTVALDWPVALDGTHLSSRLLPADSPILILLPGLTGGSGDSYVRYLLLESSRRGWRCVVFNSRGCADSPVTSTQFYSASFTEDLRQVVKHVATRFPKSRFYAAGWSLGANILVRYVGQEGENCPLSGAVSLANPFDLIKADENFRKGFNKIYDRSLTRNLRKIFQKHAPLFEEIGGEYNILKAANANTVRDFDEGLTRVSFGFKTVDEYYYKSSSSKSIKDVKIPLFCVQAKTDPIAPAWGIPYGDIKNNPNCLLVVTPTGGHLGWISGKNVPFGAPWTDDIVMDYLGLLDSILDSKTAFQKTGGQLGEVELVKVETWDASDHAEPIAR